MTIGGWVPSGSVPQPNAELAATATTALTALERRTRRRCNMPVGVRPKPRHMHDIVCACTRMRARVCALARRRQLSAAPCDCALTYRGHALYPDCRK